MTTGLTNTTSDVEWELAVDDRVFLRPEVSEVYEMAPAYAEGWIRGRRVDPIGDFKMVYIEWDASHWTYNGQPNMWTFEDHLDKVRDKKMADETPDNEGPNKEAIATALGVLAQALGVGSEPAKSPKTEPERTEEEAGEERAEAVTPDNVKQFEHIFERAVEVARDSDAFIIACVSKSDAPEDSGAQFVMTPALFSYSLSPESAILLDAQLGEVVSESHQALAIGAIRRLLDEQDDPE